MSDSDTPRPSTPSADHPGDTPPQTPQHAGDPRQTTPWSGANDANASSNGPGDTRTLPRYDTAQSAQNVPPGGQHAAGGYPGGGSTPPPGSPWANPTPAGPPPRRRAPVGLIAGVLVGALVVGGVGGYVGYEAASSQSSGSSVLSGPSTTSASTPAAPPGSVESVAQKVLPSVVQLKGASGEGSGIVISNDGLILTNAHVLEAGQSQASESPFGGLIRPQQQSAPQLQAVFQNGQAVPVQVVGTDATADLAVVRAQGVSGLAPVALGSSNQLQVGQGVVAVGSPLGLSGTVTSGIVSALGRPVATGGAQSSQDTVISAIQTDAAINPGNSGGALVDMDGRVVGITSAIASLGSGGGGGGGGQQSGSIGLGFAIPIDQAKRIGDELVAQGFANQAVLGVGIAQSGAGSSGAASDGSGAVLGTVQPGGAGAGAGLRPGDVVTRLDNQVIDDGDALVAAVRAQQPGAQVTLTVSSDGAAPRQVPVTLGTQRAPSS